MRNIFLIVVVGLVSQALIAQEFKDKSIVFSLDLTQPMQSNTLPKIQWVMPLLELTGVSEPEATIEALIESNHALSNISVTVKSGDQTNVQPVPLGSNEFTKNLSFKVILFQGDNEIKLTVSNNKGGKVSSTRLMAVGKDVLAKHIHANRKDYALIFATDRYDSWTDLLNPIAGAEALNRIVKNDYGFETEIVKNPSIQDIRRKLAEYEAKSYASQDQLFVYFAGNCYFDKLLGYGYVVAANSVKDDSKMDTYLSQTVLRITLNNFKCEHIFLAMDVCCADLADPKYESAQTDDLMTQQILIDKLGMKTRKFLISGDTEFKSDNAPGHYSPFTSKLLESLKPTQNNRKPKTFSEINSYFKSLDSYSGGFGLDTQQSEFVFVPR